MTRYRLKNGYLKNQNTTDLLQKTKFDCFVTVIVTEFKKTKNSGKRIKPFFSDKGLASSNSISREKSNLFTDNQKISNLFNTYFIGIANTLQLKEITLTNSKNLYLKSL